MTFQPPPPSTPPGPGGPSYPVEASGPADRFDGPRRGGPVGRAALAWLVIVLVAGITIVGNHWPAGEEDETDQTLELLLLRIQAQYMVGVGRLTGEVESVLAQAPALNVGSVTRRQRYVALVAELGGPFDAGVALAELDLLIDDEISRAGREFALSETESATQEILRGLYLDESGDPLDDSPDDRVARLAALSPEDRETLRSALGWFSGAVLAPEGTADFDARDRFIEPTRAVAVIVIGGFLAGMAAGLAGFAALIVMAVLVFKGTVESGLGPCEGHPGIYAETFAVWLVTFVVLGLVGGVAAALIPASGLIFPLAGFLASLVALLWPVKRGVPWESVKRDVGLAPSDKPWLEALVGLGGYFAALPMLAVGLLLTVILLTIQGLFLPEPGPFDTAAAPAHPIVLQLADSGIWLKLQVLLLASFAAPIVEETMFRGVLYRHLRESSRRFGTGLSILFSGGVNALLFAAIHPQGWVAIPALMALAFSFLLVREWRGSLLAPMILHGISNGVVMIGLFLVLDAH